MNDGKCPDESIHDVEANRKRRLNEELFGADMSDDESVDDEQRLDTILGPLGAVKTDAGDGRGAHGRDKAKVAKTESGGDERVSEHKLPKIEGLSKKVRFSPNEEVNDDDDTWPTDDENTAKMYIPRLKYSAKGTASSEPSKSAFKLGQSTPQGNRKAAASSEPSKSTPGRRKAYDSSKNSVAIDDILKKTLTDAEASSSAV